jgi:hypothetical protein
MPPTLEIIDTQSAAMEAQAAWKCNSVGRMEINAGILNGDNDNNEDDEEDTTASQNKSVKNWHVAT